MSGGGDDPYVVGRAMTASPLVSCSRATARGVDVIGREQVNSHRRIEDGQAHALSWASPAYGADLAEYESGPGNGPVQVSWLQVPAHGLLPFDRFEQGLEVALAEPLGPVPFD